MKIVDISVDAINLPFRFSFKHSLAERSFSRNVIVKACIEDNKGAHFVGYGEGIPRDYVTGEKIEQINEIFYGVYLPRVLGKSFSNSILLYEFLSEQVESLANDNKTVGAFWCALETALLDAACKAENISLLKLFSAESQKVGHNSIKYGAVIPFGNKKALIGMLLFFKACGFSTVKIKVGKDPEHDLDNIRLARLIMGQEAILRIDANCAWSVEQTIDFVAKSQAYKIASIEQPLVPHDFEGLIYLASRLPLPIVLDESLCTVEQAKIFADKNVPVEFNIRLSKVGGMINASKIWQIAHDAGIKCHLGAQVGESGILTTAARMFALCYGPFLNHEGAANILLLKKDITVENLTFSYAGLGKLPSGGHKPGLGIMIDEKRLDVLSQENIISSKTVALAKHTGLY